MKFKKNIHISKWYCLNAIKRQIRRYPKKYATPKYLQFCKKMLENGWKVKIYTAKVSKYVFIIKRDRVYKIRFSNHRPLLFKEEEEDCDYYVGISNKQMTTTEELIIKLCSNAKLERKKD